MKKVLLCFVVFAILSCASDDYQEISNNVKGISFRLNGIDYFLSEYEVTLFQSNPNFRVVEASFENDSKSIRISVVEEETNEIAEFVFIDHEVAYISDPFSEEGTETSILKHTAVEMVGTFRVILEDVDGKPQFSFINGKIDIDF